MSLEKQVENSFGSVTKDIWENIIVGPWLYKGLTDLRHYTDSGIYLTGQFLGGIGVYSWMNGIFTDYPTDGAEIAACVWFTGSLLRLSNIWGLPKGIADRLWGTYKLTWKYLYKPHKKK